VKRLDVLAVTFGALMVLAISGSTTRAQDKPTSYPLLCRGSKESKIGTSSAGGFAVLEFHKGNRPAESGLAPGECSWMDRGMREAESASLLQGVSTTSVISGTAGKKVDWGWLEALKDSDNYWMFYVYSERGTLVVTDSKPYNKTKIERARPDIEVGLPASAEKPGAISRARPASPPGAARSGAAPTIGAAADVAPAEDFPMFVAANSGKIVFLADMTGGGWSDYLRERALALSMDDSGILYYLSADTTQLLARENKLGGAPQRLDMRVPIVDFKFDPAGAIVAVSSQENCLIRMNDFNGGGFIRFGSKGSGDGQFHLPQGIALDSKSRIYIADTGNHRILRMDNVDGSGWTAFGSRGAGVGHFNAPWRIWVDKRDRIYVVDLYNGRIVRMDDIDGSGWIAYGGFASPRFVTTDKLNRIYVADPEVDQVIRLDDMTGKGRTVLQFKRDTSSMEALNKPGSLGGPAAILVLRPAQAGGRVR